MKLSLYKQTTYETCLSVALMLLLNINPTIKRELAIWKAGWNFNFLIGQTNYICEKYNKKIKIFIENKYYFKELLNLKINNITLENKNITKSLITTLAENKEFILYIDNYIIHKIVHAPHFIIIEKLEGVNFIIFDPWDGKRKIIKIDIIFQAVNSLRKHLKYSPVLIY